MGTELSFQQIVPGRLDVLGKAVELDSCSASCTKINQKRIKHLTIKNCNNERKKEDCNKTVRSLKNNTK